MTVEQKLVSLDFDDSTGKFTFIPDATDTNNVFSGSAEQSQQT